MRPVVVVLFDDVDESERVVRAGDFASVFGFERDGLVRRTVFPEVPVRVEYALTDAGRTLLGPLRVLEEWSIEHLGDVSASQEAYDRAD